MRLEGEGDDDDAGDDDVGDDGDAGDDGDEDGDGNCADNPAGLGLGGRFRLFLNYRPTFFSLIL